MNPADDSPTPPAHGKPGRLTRHQRSAINRAAWKDRHASPLPATSPGVAPPAGWNLPAAGTASAPMSDAEPGAADGLTIPPAALLAHAELETEARRLYSRSLKNLEAILNDPRSTNQDKIQAASHLRIAASIGQSDPAPTVYRLPMASLLGAEAPDQASDRGGVRPKEQ